MNNANLPDQVLCSDSWHVNTTTQYTNTSEVNTPVEIN
jgi:hypothetical protein